MENEITLYEGKQAVVKTSRMDYIVTCPINGVQVKLEREIDFGKFGQAQRPCLLKAGAEKVAMAYGLLQHYTIESKVENTGDEPFFFYMVRCDLVKVASDGKEYVFSSGLGSANSKEKQNGRNGAFDSANAVLKKAVKRALVAAAVNIGGLSGAFYQDIDDDKFVEEGMKEVQSSMKDTDPITNKQGKRLIALAGEAGYNFAAMKKVLADAGFPDMKAITQAEYDKACALFLNAEG